jgi:ATP-dependent helicase/nuclease subunit B
MLEFIIGRAGSGKTASCLKAIGDKVRQAPVGPALILLLPEHMTYKVERNMAASLADAGSGFVRCHISGFRHFAQQVLAAEGGAACPRITEIGKRLLFRKVLDKRRPVLKVFQKAAGQRGFTGSLACTIEEFKSYGLDAAGLVEAAGKLDDADLSQKLAELSLLYQDFSSAMQGRYNDAEDMMDALAERLPEAGMLHGAEVWIDGFVFFNPQERRVVHELLRCAADVHITLTMDTAETVQNTRQTGVFHRAWQTMQAVRQMAQDMGIANRISRLEPGHRFLKPALAAIEERFPLPAPPPSSAGDGVTIVEAATRRLEASAAAADMIRLCREEGYHWHDIGILVRDEDHYMDMLGQVLDDYDIPYFNDSKRMSLHHPLAELLRSALQVLHSWRHEAVIRCLRTGFFPVTRDQIDILENYLLEFGIKGIGSWQMAADWDCCRRYSLEESDDGHDDAKEYLQRINHIRRQASSALLDLASAMSKAERTRDFVTALYGFLVELEVPDTLSSWSAEDESSGRLAAAREHQQIWDGVMELLEQLVDTSGNDAMQQREFEGVLDDGLDALRVSLIPPGLDYVTIASFDQNSLDNERALYVLGMNEGVMPRHSKETGLLSDADRLHLAETGTELPGGALEGSFGERYLLYKGFTEAREYLWLSYALADSEGNGLGISSLIGQFRRLLPKARFRSIPLESAERQDAALLAEGRQAVSGLAAALRGCRERGGMPDFWCDVYNWALVQETMRPRLDMVVAGLFSKAEDKTLSPQLTRQLFLEKQHMRGSVTRFEIFRACPFRHFAQYGMKLRERQEYRFQAFDLGLILHEAMREFGMELQDEGRRWSEVGKDECHSICHAIIADVISRLPNGLLLSTKQYENLQQRIQRTAEHSLQHLIAFDAVSGFQPRSFEYSFGSEHGKAPLSYDLGKGSRLDIVGQIDRIDRAVQGGYFLIIDYKTGHAALNMLEVFYGLSMQLITYMLVARNLLHSRGEAGLPAGMLYCFLKADIMTSERKLEAGEAEKMLQKALAMPGWVLAEPDVIRAIDATQSFIKVRLKKDGSIHASSRSSVKTQAEFSLLLDYTSLLLQDTGRDILQGSIQAYPCHFGTKDACQYCPFMAFCGFDMMLPGFSRHKLIKVSDADIMEKMAAAVKDEDIAIEEEK